MITGRGNFKGRTLRYTCIILLNDNPKLHDVKISVMTKFGSSTTLAREKAVFNIHANKRKNQQPGVIGLIIIPI